MSDLLWSFDQLSRFTRYEDPEVRYWAAERLVALFPDEASDVIAELLFDDHDATPDLVAEHLGRHGGPRHIPILLRGFRKTGSPSRGRCLEALARLGYEATPDLAKTALHQKDVPESSLGIMVAALVDMSGGTGRAAERAREFLLRRPELFAEPAGLRGAIALYAPADFSDLIHKWITALHFAGPEQLDACIRVLLEELQLEDSGWCIRTGRNGRIDLERTLKAIESGYDVEVRTAIPRESFIEISEKLGTGQFSDIASALGRYVRSRLPAAPDGPAGGPLHERLRGLGEAFMTPSILRLADRLEPGTQQWLIGILISATVKVTIDRDYVRELEAAGGSLDALLSLAAVETSCLLNVLPVKLGAAADAASAAGRSQVMDWCVRTLEARGPFFPKAIALDTLGVLGAADLIPEIATHLADDNAYVYGAAERALARIGAPVIEHARLALRREGVHPEAVQSLVRIACELTSTESLRLVLDHFDELFETIGPEAASEIVGTLGHADLLPHLRRWLDRNPAMVGHALLLIGAINNLPIPEEESILKAIDDYWKGAGEGAEPGRDPGQYLM